MEYLEKKIKILLREKKFKIVNVNEIDDGNYRVYIDDFFCFSLDDLSKFKSLLEVETNKMVFIFVCKGYLRINLI